MKSILIVDDEAHVARVLQLMLERAGYRVRIAPDGLAGLSQALAEAPDALVTDIQMPHMTGRELVAALHRELPDRRFPIFVMTSMTAREERDWVRGYDNLSFLEKPLSPRQLVVTLARHFETAAQARGDEHA